MAILDSNHLVLLLQVMQGCFLIVELLLPSRNLLLLYLWWQYLQMRYLLDQSDSIKRAFTTVDASIMNLLSHRLVFHLHVVIQSILTNSNTKVLLHH